VTLSPELALGGASDLSKSEARKIWGLLCEPYDKQVSTSLPLSGCDDLEGNTFVGRTKRVLLSEGPEDTSSRTTWRSWTSTLSKSVKQNAIH
jgi:hypothetical protein